MAEPAAATKFHVEPAPAEGLAGGRRLPCDADGVGTWPPAAADRACDFRCGCLADFVWYNGMPLGILGTSHGLTDALEFLLIVKIVGVLVGLALQVSLVVVAYVIGGFERLLSLQGQGRRKPIDFDLYGPRKDD